MSSAKTKIVIVLGTRPEIIKFSPIIRRCQEDKIDYKLIHTNQHYSHGLDMQFFEELNLPLPDYNLNVGSASHSLQLSKMLLGLEPILNDLLPKFVLVQGDTNSTLAGALTAAKIPQVRVAHLEAGLRSFDREMPEEINRIITDHVSDLLFPPTEDSKLNLVNEGVLNNKIFISGNTVVEAFSSNLKYAEESQIIKQKKLYFGQYFLITFYRQENVDNEINLRSFFEILIKLSCESKVVFCMHPRTKMQLKKKKLLGELENKSNIVVLEGVGYLDFLCLLQNCEIVLTDSGGVQEEACIAKRPCITLRDTTERPETIEVGANVLTHLDNDAIDQAIQKFRKTNLSYVNPYGDFLTSDIVINEILNFEQ